MDSKQLYPVLDLQGQHYRTRSAAFRLVSKLRAQTTEFSFLFPHPRVLNQQFQKHDMYSTLCGSIDAANR